MSELKPVLKWAGGKQNLLQELNKVFDLFDFKDHTFFDVFVGGGSVFLNVQNRKVVINDYNRELINVYKTIRDCPSELIKVLKKHNKNNSKDYYYFIREQDRKKNFNNKSDIEKAARTIYLNRMCFNGLMRYNKNGYFNVPIGRNINPNIAMEDRIYALNNYLNNNDVDILCGDFAEACSKCRKGDIIYFDPPYDYEKEGFTSYTKVGWSRDDLDRLKLLCDKLVKKGCHVVVSNNDTKYVNEIFKEYNIKHIKAHRFINSDIKSRKNADEVIIYE